MKGFKTHILLEMKLNRFLKQLIVFLSLFGLGAFIANIAKNECVLKLGTQAADVVIEDSENVFRAANITRSETEYKNDVEAEPGEAIQFMVMAHLGAEGTSADNVKIKVDLQESTVKRSGKYELVSKAKITSSENNVEEEASVVVSSEQDLVFIPEHGVIVTSHGNLPSNVSETPFEVSNPEDLFDEGIELGSIESVSTIYVSFKAYVSNRTADMSISKQVANASQPDGKWHDSVCADPGDRVRFQIVVRNTGASDLNDVLITDKFPEGISYINGSSEYSTPFSDGFKVLADSWITGKDGVSQANLGKLPPGKDYNAIIVFDARVSMEIEDCVTYENTAQAKANEYPDWIYDQAEVSVCAEEEKETDLEIEKFVKWEETDDWYENIDKDEHLFEPGERVEYKIIVKNNGNADAHNVRVVDEVADYISWENGDGDWDSEERKIRFDLGTVKAGEEVRLDYEGKVFDEEDLPYTDREQKNVATLYKDEENIDDDHCQVWIDGPDVEGEVTELPKAGGDSLGMLLIAVGMVVTGWGLRRISLAWSGKIS